MTPDGPIPPPTAPPHRRFTLADAMILIVATAPPLALIRNLFSWPVPATLGPATPLNVLGLVSGCVVPTTPLAASWACALLALRVFQPRPPRRILLRQPGSAATRVAGLAAPGGTAALVAWDAGQASPESWRHLAVFAIGGLTPLIAALIALAWLVLLATPRVIDPPRVDWIEAVGRALGAYWILAGPACLMFLILILRS